MNNYSSVFSQIIILYIIMLIGAIVNRLKVVNDETIAGMTKFMLNVTIPATILTGLKDSGALLNADVLMMAGLTIFSYIIVFILSLLILRVLFVPKTQRPFYQYISIFGNIGFIGYPMVMIMIGSHAILLAAIANVLYSLMLYSLGIYLMSRYGEREGQASFEWKLMINPGTIAAVICILLFFCGIKLPEVIGNTADLLGGLTSPLAMIVVGASINRIKLGGVFNNYRILIISIIKMTVYPVAFAYLLRFLGFSGMPALVSVLFMGMPIATTSVITAMEYNRNNLAKASEATVISTIMLVLTIPVLVYAMSIITGAM